VVDCLCPERYSVRALTQLLHVDVHELASSAPLVAQRLLEPDPAKAGRIPPSGAGPG